MSLADNLNEIAAQKNISMYRVAKDGELSISYVWDIFKGNRENPSLNILKKLAKGLDVTVEDLINWGGS